MCAERFKLVVHPEDCLWSRHDWNIASACGGLNVTSGDSCFASLHSGVASMCGRALAPGGSRMNGFLAPTEQHLISDLQATARGPKLNGLFALWLFVRACDGMLPPNCLSEKANRRRLEGLKRRLSSLSLPAPLRRGLTGGLRELEGGTGEAAAFGLRQMVAPVRDVLGSKTADSVLSASRSAEDAVATTAARVS